MKLTGNTVLITGGGSGIGRGLAEEFHKRGNKVIISGRGTARLAEVAAANPGMEWVELDVEDPASIKAVTEKLIAEYPALNVLINNAGQMRNDAADQAIDDEVLVSTLTSNVMGPIRLTSALIEQLKKQDEAVVINVTSGLAFVPLALNAIYSATKAALHSYTLSQRFRLKGTNVRVLELAPPYVQTGLAGERQANDPNAMPLKEFIEETMQVLRTDVDEVLVERVKPLRNNPGAGEWVFVDKFNAMMLQARGGERGEG